MRGEELAELAGGAETRLQVGSCQRWQRMHLKEQAGPRHVFALDTPKQKALHLLCGGEPLKTRD